MTAPDPVDLLVRSFVRVLDAAWPEVVSASRLSKIESYLEDWLQANWEMVVEGGLPPGTFLEVYGEGADCNGRSSRVYNPEAAATHAVFCHPRPGVGSVLDRLSGQPVAFSEVGFPVEEFVSTEGTWYERKPPFDCALIEFDDNTFLFGVEDVCFALGPALRG